MNILIELPTWLGDTVMVTPSIKILMKKYPNARIDIIGTKSSIELLSNLPNLENSFAFNKTVKSMLILRKKLNKYTFFISYRSSLRTKILNFFIRKDKFFQYKKSNIYEHQVVKYSNFINNICGTTFKSEKLDLYSSNKRLIQSPKKIIGINPGAEYGSAKRWDEKNMLNFVEMIAEKFYVVVFGGVSEIEISGKIEKLLSKNKENEYLNLAGKTSISELKEFISSVDMFVTGDTGPMHEAAAMQIPTIAIFGPTKNKETSQWKNDKGIILSTDISCRPCMKRVCPLGHHNCMKLITPDMVLKQVNLLIN